MSTDAASADAATVSKRQETEGRLMRGLAELEAMPLRLMSVEPETGDPGSLTAEIDAARAISEGGGSRGEWAAESVGHSVLRNPDSTTESAEPCTRQTSRQRPIDVSHPCFAKPSQRTQDRPNS